MNKIKYVYEGIFNGKACIRCVLEKGSRHLIFHKWEKNNDLWKQLNENENLFIDTEVHKLWKEVSTKFAA